ncbi:DciA family protein [Nakamurella lactea]|uniref:DciA family protein n=1 Tax=Nakamurella lactea TaxID=459515 RepID=UPI00040C8312|nr:DciA family protein [Nakamurella lactea]
MADENDAAAGSAAAGGASTGRGSDLAREALAAARKQNAAKRKDRIPLTQRSGGSTRSLRRRRWSGSGPDFRDPQPLSATLQKFVKTAGAGADIGKATLFARWPQIVGAALAEHAHPVSLTDGELVLQCESTAWASQVRLMAPQVVRKINEAVGHGSVRRIKAQGPSGPSWRFGPRHVPGRGPRDTYG